MSKKIGGGANETLRELEKARTKEGEILKLNAKLEEDVLKLRLQAESTALRIGECSDLLAGIKNADELPAVKEAVELLKKALNGEAHVGTPARESPIAKSTAKASAKEIKVLLDEVKTLKHMNSELIAKLQAKDKDLARRSATAKAESGPQEKQEAPATAAAITTDIGDIMPPRSYTGEQVGNCAVLSRCCRERGRTTSTLIKMDWCYKLRPWLVGTCYP